MESRFLLGCPGDWSLGGTISRWGGLPRVKPTRDRREAVPDGLQKVVDPPECMEGITRRGDDGSPERTMG